MIWIVSAILVINLVALGLVVLRQLALQGELKLVREALEQLEQRRGMLPAGSAAAWPADGSSGIQIRIDNHLELASSRSRFAAALGSVSPAALRALVDREVLRILREELSRQGVVAQVSRVS